MALPSIKDAIQEGAVTGLSSAVLTVQDVGQHSKAFDKSRPTQVDDAARDASTALSPLAHISTVDFHTADELVKNAARSIRPATETRPKGDDFASKVKPGSKSNGPGWAV